MKRPLNTAISRAKNDCLAHDNNGNITRYLDANDSAVAQMAMCAWE